MGSQSRFDLGKFRFKDYPVLFSTGYFYRNKIHGVYSTGTYGLSEPVGTDKISPEEADLLIVPALGFNEKGFRLGRGAGFYDRAFQNIKPKKMIGISFLELFSIDFPSSDYDIRVGELVTDSGVLFF